MHVVLPYTNNGDVQVLKYLCPVIYKTVDYGYTTYRLSDNSSTLTFTAPGKGGVVG